MLGISYYKMKYFQKLIIREKERVGGREKKFDDSF